MTKLKVDQIPAAAQHSFFQAARARGGFWLDMFTISLELGLRNAEARELTIDKVDLENNLVTLHDAKQQRAHITKTANKSLSNAWLKEARKTIAAQLIAEGESRLMAMIATKSIETETALNDLCEELGIELTEKRLAFYASNEASHRAAAVESVPSARPIDLTPFPATRAILARRCRQYADLGGYLFPACELNSSRAKGKGYAPVSRQSVNRVIKSIDNEIREASKAIAKALQGIRLGLHSFRKAALQRVTEQMGDLLEASKWLWHGNGSGSIATSELYLDRSEQKSKKARAKLTPPEVTTI